MWEWSFVDLVLEELDNLSAQSSVSQLLCHFEDEKCQKFFTQVNYVGYYLHFPYLRTFVFSADAFFFTSC